MPRIPTYQPGQVGPVQITGERLRAVDNNGGVFGGIAAGLGDAGQALGKYVEVQQQVDLHYADAATKDADNQVAQAYATMGFDGPRAFFNLTGRDALIARGDFEAGVNDAIAKAREQVAATPIAARMFDAVVDRRKADWTRAIGQHVVQQTRAYAVDSGTARIGLSFNGAVHSALNAEESDKQIETARSEIASVGQILGWAPERVSLETETRVSSARADVGVAINDMGPGGPAAALAYAELHKAEFTGDDYARLTQRISATERAHAADIARAQAVTKAEFTERVATVEADAGRGLDVSAKLPDMIKQAHAVGDTSTASRLKGLLGDQGFARQYQQATPLQREQRIGQLAALRRPGEAEQQELHWLREKSGALDAQFNRDPAGYMIASGHPAPPIGPARAEWAAAMSRATGRPVPPLTQEEATQMQANVASGVAGQDSALAALDRLPAGTSRAAAAKQIAPDDMVFQHMSQLNPLSRPVVRAGAEAIKANPLILNPTKDARVVQTYTALESQLRLALKEFQPADQQAVISVARQYVAGKLSHGDWSTDRTSTEQMYQMALRVALGGYSAQGKQLGGLGDWNGHPVALPDGSTNATFANGLRQGLAQRKPVNPDGTPIALNSVVPVMIAPNTYRLEGPDGRVVVDAKGRPIILPFKGAYR